MVIDLRRKKEEKIKTSNKDEWLRKYWWLLGIGAFVAVYVIIKLILWIAIAGILVLVYYLKNGKLTN